MTLEDKETEKQKAIERIFEAHKRSAFRKYKCGISEERNRLLNKEQQEIIKEPNE